MRHTSRISCSDNMRAFFCNLVRRLIAFFNVLFKTFFWSFNAFCSSFNRRMSSCKFAALPTDPLFPTATFAIAVPCSRLPQPSSDGHADVLATGKGSLDMAVVSWEVAMVVEMLSQKLADDRRHSTVNQHSQRPLGAILPIFLV